MFNNKDLIFISTILSFEEIIEKSHQKTFDIDFNFDIELIKKGLVEVIIKNKKEIKKLFQIGTYNENTEIFRWNESARDFMNSLIPKDNKTKETFLHGFGSTFEKLCSKSEINLKKEYKNIIPYLHVILLHPYNLYKATTNEKPEETTYFAIGLNLNKSLIGDFMKRLSKFTTVLNLARTKKTSKKSNIKIKKSKKGSKK
jgi:hypothetical protein